MTPGQKARSGGRDGKGQDAWELLMLRHLGSSPSNSLPLTFSMGSLAPHQKLLAHTLQTAAPHLPVAAGCCASSVELLDSCELTSVTHPTRGRSYRAAVPFGTWHTASKTAGTLSPGHRCDDAITLCSHAVCGVDCSQTS